MAVGFPSGVRLVQVTTSRAGYAYRHACALADDGAVYCWGSNRQNQLGDGTLNGTTISSPNAPGQATGSAWAP